MVDTTGYRALAREVVRLAWHDYFVNPQVPSTTSARVFFSSVDDSTLHTWADWLGLDADAVRERFTQEAQRRCRRRRSA